MNKSMLKALVTGIAALVSAISVSAVSIAKAHSRPGTFCIHSQVDTIGGLSYTVYTVQYLNPNGKPGTPLHTNWLKIADNQTAVAAQMMFYPVSNGVPEIQAVKPRLVPTFLHGELTPTNDGEFQFAVMNGHEGTAPVHFTVTDVQLKQTKSVGYQYHTGPAIYGVVGPAGCDQWGCGGFYNVAPGQTTITLPVMVEDKWQNIVPVASTVDVAPIYVAPDYSLNLGGQMYSWQTPIASENLSSEWQPLTLSKGQGTLSLTITGFPANTGRLTAINIASALPGVTSVIQQFDVVNTLFLRFPSSIDFGTQIGWGTMWNQANLAQTITLPTAMHVGEQLSEALFDIKNLPIYPVMENAQGLPITEQKYGYYFEMTSSNPAVLSVPSPGAKQGYNAVAEKPGTATLTIWCPNDSAQPTVKETISVVEN